jgi:pantoate kinase
MSSFAPANISCLFKIKKGETPETTGSYGLGITLTEGVEVSIKQSEKTEIFYNGEKVKFPTVERVIDRLLYSSSEEQSDESRSSGLRSNNIILLILLRML